MFLIILCQVKHVCLSNASAIYLLTYSNVSLFYFFKKMVPYFLSARKCFDKGAYPFWVFIFYPYLGAKLSKFDHALLSEV